MAGGAVPAMRGSHHESPGQRGLEMNGSRVRVLAGAIIMLSVGCAHDDGPLGVGDGDSESSEVARSELSCTVALPSGALKCQPLSLSLPSGIDPAILGGQGVYVHLESSRVVYDAVAGTFAADVTLRNLITQTLGAIEVGGEIFVDPEGVRVFFLEEAQVVAGTGTISLSSHTGQAAFTGPDQYYIQYDQALSPGQTSFPEEWGWSITGTVDTFTFKIAVSARVLDEGSIDPGLKFVSSTLSAGRGHNCGVGLDGAARCWGLGEFGRLGTGGVADELTPAPVAASVDGPLSFAVISAGGEHSCGITTAGEAWCWGRGAFGQLGAGAPLDDSSIPTAVEGGHTFLSISSGYKHTCGVIASGDGYCWGLADAGRLGNNMTDSTAVDQPALIAGGLAFDQISAGAQHTCGLTPAGEAWCWGLGEQGRLGTGATDTTAAPAPVAGTPGGPAAFTSITAGGLHTCALTAAGAAWCWGANNAGQLGNGDVSEPTATTPIAVGGSLELAAISAGGLHTCALDRDGAAWCWGYGAQGQLGNGGTDPASLPSPVATAERFVSITAGEFHTCAATAGGDLHCWGTRLDETIATTPVLVANLNR